MDNYEIGKITHDNAVDKGFYEEIISLMTNEHLTKAEKEFIRYLWRASRLMLIVSELGEALEGLRKDNLGPVPGSGGLLEELADVEIRLRDFVADEGMDLDQAVVGKIAYNVRRPRKHGKIE